MEFSTISKRSFCIVLALDTCGEEKLLTAVDHVTGVIVNDQVAVLRLIRENFASNEKLSNQHTDFLEIVRNLRTTVMCV